MTDTARRDPAAQGDHGAQGDPGSQRDAGAVSGGGASGSSASVDAGLYRRILRREQHSSRSGSAIVVLVLLTLVVGYVGVEAVYAALGRPALLFSPVDVVSTLSTAVEGGTSGIVIGAGVVAALVGLVLIVLALTAGRRGRHTIDDDRVAAVVDDGVIASSLARTARVSGRLSDQQVKAWVSRRQAQIDLTPTSGLSVDDQTVESATRDELDSVAYRPSISARVRVTDKGRLGA